MLFLFGERVHGTEMDAGERDCPVCRRRTIFKRVVETSYFTVFGLRLLPIERVADYLRCTQCDNAFPAMEEGSASDEPTHVPVVRAAVIYLMLGYGMTEHRETARQIVEKVTGFGFPDDEMTRLMRNLDAGKEDFFETLREHAPQMNVAGKREVLQAAFLMAYVSCEMQHEDRVRINLMGNALGVSLQFVEQAIGTVRAEKYYGIRRLVPTRAT